MTKVYVDETIKEKAWIEAEKKTSYEFVTNMLREGASDDMIYRFAKISVQRLAEIKAEYQQSLK